MYKPLKIAVNALLHGQTIVSCSSGITAGRVCAVISLGNFFFFISLKIEKLRNGV